MLALTAASLFDGLGGELVSNPVVLVQGKSIYKVGSRNQVSIPDGTQVISLDGCTLMPGLIDCHVHISRDDEANYILLELRETSAFRAIKSLVHAQADLNAGYTTLRTAGDKGYVDIALKKAVNAGIVVGPRIAAAGRVLCVTGGHRDGYFAPEVKYEGLAIIVDGAEAIRKAVRELVKLDADWVKLIVTGGVVSPTSPELQQMSSEEIRAATDEAKRLGIRTSAHVYGAEAVKAAVKAGINSIEHGVGIDQEAADLMARNNVYLAPTLRGIYDIIMYGSQAGVEAFAIEKAKRRWELCIKSFETALKAGVKVVMASDAGGTCLKHGTNSRELELMVEAGMNEIQALLSATATAAELLGMQEDLGTVEEGKLADLVAVEGNPLEDINVMRNVHFVMKGGQIILRKGEEKTHENSNK